MDLGVEKNLYSYCLRLININSVSNQIGPHQEVLKAIGTSRILAPAESDEVLYQKLNYIHLNPVVAGFVSQPEDWMYSSAKDHSGLPVFCSGLVIDPRAASSM